MAGKALGWLLIPAVMAVAAIIAALALTAPAGAQAAECQTAGIVPGSLEIVSTSNLVGAVSGHTIRFQLCPYPESPAFDIDNARPVEVGLLWEWFSLENPEQAGITLTATDAGKSWPAAAAFADRACYYWIKGWRETPHKRDRTKGVSVGFTESELDALFPTHQDAPLTLQFDIPGTAGMLNPTFADDYPWQIVFRYQRGDYWETFTEAVAMPIAPEEALYFDPDATLHLSTNSEGIGGIVTVVGEGFPPLAPVRSVHIGKADAFVDELVITDAHGGFRQKIYIPVLDNGTYNLQAQVEEIAATAKFIMTNPEPLWAYPSSKYALWNLGDNLVRVFHFEPKYKYWTFYDPEIPEVSTLTHFIYRECYWILVKEPAEVLLNVHIRNLTCQPDGKCWNFIVW